MSIKTISYYNENDPYTAEWLRNLIKEGLITPGDVDERDIREVSPRDVRGYTRCHWFAGIAGWDLALELAGWGETPVWTGSCPCQPFSSAGRRKGNEDERHLWPAWFNLIRQCKPQYVFGEQVASSIKYGWLDGVSDDLEAEGYAVGAVVLPACSVGAPHIRQRLWWVADARLQRWEQGWSEARELEPETNRDNQLRSKGNKLADPKGKRFNRIETSSETYWRGFSENGCSVGNTNSQRPQGWIKRGVSSGERSFRSSGMGNWIEFETVDCADGKTRRIEPGTLPLAYGVPARVGRLRAYGNAIVPQAAAEVIKAFINEKARFDSPGLSNTRGIYHE